MLKRENTLSTLEAFNKYVVQQARSNLTKGGRNVSKNLYDSLKGNATVSANSIETSFEMEEYGEYQDKGVRGKTSSAKAPNSPFKFGSGKGKEGGLTAEIKKWVKKRGIQFKNKKDQDKGVRVKGRFLSYDETASLIIRSIYNKGIKPTSFFTRPFELAFAKLPDEIIEAYGLDVESYLKYSLDVKRS